MRSRRSEPHSESTETRVAASTQEEEEEEGRGEIEKEKAKERRPQLGGEGELAFGEPGSDHVDKGGKEREAGVVAKVE